MVTSDWCWSYAGAPFSIHVPFPVVQRLHAAVDECPGTEVGGVLLGTADLSHSCIEILDFALVASSQAGDGTYTWDLDQLQRLQSTTSSNVIGYFRTHPQASLELRASELDFVKQHFADPTNIVLLIEPERKIAGFFFWCGDFFTPVSFRDFTFDMSPAPQPQQVPRPHNAGRRLLSEKNTWAGHEYYTHRAVLATGLAVLTVAFMRVPLPGVRNDNKSPVPLIANTTPTIIPHVDPDGTPSVRPRESKEHANASSQIDTPMAGTTKQVSGPKKTSRVNMANRSKKSNGLYHRRAALNADSAPSPRSAPGPLAEPRVIQPKTTYFWR
jgi:hypothetical protein